MMSDTIIWVSGATRGLGSEPARTVPFPGARIINLSRRQNPDFETRHPRAAFQERADDFGGSRAIFIHNAYYPAGIGFAGEVSGPELRASLQANAVAPLVLGDMFLRYVRPAYESGLVLMSSAAARHPFEGGSAYCAAKAGVEMWIRVVRRELKRRGRTTWVVAVRPGFVDTPSTRHLGTLSEDIYPIGPRIAGQLQNGQGVLTPDEAGRDIWASLPPKADTRCYSSVRWSSNLRSRGLDPSRCRNHGRLSREQPIQQHVVNLGIAIRAAIGKHGDAIIEVTGVPDRRKYDAAGRYPRKNDGVDSSHA